jgi:transposase-like protein
VHWFRNGLAHLKPKKRPAINVVLKTIPVNETREPARRQLRDVADAPRDEFEKLATMMDDSCDEVLAYMALPSSTGRRPRPPIR